MKRIVLAAVCSAGCIETFAPEVGPLVVPGCTEADSDPSSDVSFGRDVRAGVFARCEACHTPEGATPIGLTIGGLDLSTHATLLAGGARSGPTLVIAGQPCGSVLLEKLSEAPPFGARMPLDGAPLTAAERQLVSDWIAEGARDN